MVPLGEITSFLDSELNVKNFQDNSNNGLQVENSGRVGRICTGVDASIEFFTKASERDAGLLICHHGISWGDSLKRITGLNYKRIKYLTDSDMALYACHLPLDAHPRIGNNALICRELGLEDIQPFGSSYGFPMGFRGVLPQEMDYKRFIELCRSIFGGILATMDFGRDRVDTVAVVSGGGSAEIMEAGELGIDVFLSGEPKLTAYHVSRESGINAVFAGHHATEIFGVRAVAELLSEKFSVESEFIDTKVPF